MTIRLMGLNLIVVGQLREYRMLKRVHRLWEEDGLQRPTPRKQERARPAAGSFRRHQAADPNQVWAKDFQFDATANGRLISFGTRTIGFIGPEEIVVELNTFVRRGH